MPTPQGLVYAESIKNCFYICILCVIISWEDIFAHVPIQYEKYLIKSI